MAQYILRHGALAAAVDTANAINLNQAGVATAIVVPQGVSKIVQVLIDISASIVAVASAGVTLEVVLTGNGLAQQQNLPAGGVREDTTSTAGAHLTAPTVMDTDITVIPGNNIDINAFMHGVDPGTPQLDVCLVFA